VTALITAKRRIALGGVALALVLAPPGVGAQENSPGAEEVPQEESPVPAVPADPNPAGTLIVPRQDQSLEQQLSDEWECYDLACEQTEWDPYTAYAELVDAGYAVALHHEADLLCRARRGAETGAVAGDILGDAERGAEIGAAIAIAMGVLQTEYLCRPDDPTARRSIRKFERDLKNWQRRFAACLRPKGYRVSLTP
jgi:hypothetical protein